MVQLDSPHIIYYFCLIVGRGVNHLYACVCGCRCGELIWTCYSWAEWSTPDNIGCQATDSDHYAHSEQASQLPNWLVSSVKLKSASLPLFTPLLWRGRGSNSGLPHPERTLLPLCYKGVGVEVGFLTWKIQGKFDNCWLRFLGGVAFWIFALIGSHVSENEKYS